MVLRFIFFLHRHSQVRSREVYGFMDVLGDIGGIYSIIHWIFGIFLYSCSHHSFTLKIIKKLFFVRTKNIDFIAGQPDYEKNSKGIKKYLQKDIVTRINKDSVKNMHMLKHNKYMKISDTQSI